MTWSEAMREVIDSIPFASYARGNGDGVTEDIFWNGKPIYKTGFPVTSMCVGAVAEAFFKTLKKFKEESDIPIRVVKSLRPWIYVYDEKHREGIAGGLTRLGWADWIEDPMDAEYGDLCQISGVSFDKRGKNGIPYWDDGHCVVITGISEREGSPVITDWSSTNDDPKPGHKHDWHFIDREKNGLKRQLFIARMKSEFLGISDE